MGHFSMEKVWKVKRFSGWLKTSCLMWPFILKEKLKNEVTFLWFHKKTIFNDIGTNFLKRQPHKHALNLSFCWIINLILRSKSPHWIFVYLFCWSIGSNSTSIASSWISFLFWNTFQSFKEPHYRFLIEVIVRSLPLLVFMDLSY